MVTLFNKQTQEVLYCVAEFEETNEIGVTSLLCTETFVKPKFNGVAFYEGANQTELDADALNNVPQEVALWKLRAVLNAMGLEQNVADAIEQLPNPPRVGATYIWNYGNTIDRNSNTIAFIQNALSLTDAQVNEIFTNANAISL